MQRDPLNKLSDVWDIEFWWYSDIDWFVDYLDYWTGYTEYEYNIYYKYDKLINNDLDNKNKSRFST